MIRCCVWVSGAANRNGLIVDALATRASGHAERLAALHLVEPYADRPQEVTLVGDKGFGTRDFVAEIREIKVRPHLAQNISVLPPVGTAAVSRWVTVGALEAVAGPFHKCTIIE